MIHRNAASGKTKPLQSLFLSLSLSSLVCLWYTNYLVSMLGFVSVSILVSVRLVSTLQTHKRIGRPPGPGCCIWWMDCSAKVRLCVSCTASVCLVYSKCCTYGRRCWLLCVIRAPVFRLPRQDMPHMPAQVFYA